LALSNDREVTLDLLKNVVSRFVQERRWQKFHDLKNLAESICIEASDLLEIFQWCTTKESKILTKDSENIRCLSNELADVMIYCLAFADALQIDVAGSVLSKLKKDERRYPVSKCMEKVPRHKHSTGRKT
jgi:NTP pyrophosphatase (non-canonical NTP hydrolase)